MHHSKWHFVTSNNLPFLILTNGSENFPGEIELKEDIEKTLKFWKITKDNLFIKTKELWLNNFRPSNTTKDLVGSGFDTSN